MFTHESIRCADEYQTMTANPTNFLDVIPQSFFHTTAGADVDMTKHSDTVSPLPSFIASPLHALTNRTSSGAFAFGLEDTSLSVRLAAQKALTAFVGEYPPLAYACLALEMDAVSESGMQSDVFISHLITILRVARQLHFDLTEFSPAQHTFTFMYPSPITDTHLTFLVSCIEHALQPLQDMLFTALSFFIFEDSHIPDSVIALCTKFVAASRTNTPSTHFALHRLFRAHSSLQLIARTTEILTLAHGRSSEASLSSLHPSVLLCIIVLSAIRAENPRLFLKHIRFDNHSRSVKKRKVSSKAVQPKTLRTSFHSTLTPRRMSYSLLFSKSSKGPSYSQWSLPRHLETNMIEFALASEIELEGAQLVYDRQSRDFEKREVQHGDSSGVSGVLALFGKTPLLSSSLMSPSPLPFVTESLSLIFILARHIITLHLSFEGNNTQLDLQNLRSRAVFNQQILSNFPFCSPSSAPTTPLTALALSVLDAVTTILDLIQIAQVRSSSLEDPHETLLQHLNSLVDAHSKIGTVFFIGCTPPCTPVENQTFVFLSSILLLIELVFHLFTLQHHSMHSHAFPFSIDLQDPSIQQYITNQLAQFCIFITSSQDAIHRVPSLPSPTLAKFIASVAASLGNIAIDATLFIDVVQVMLQELVCTTHSATFSIPNRANTTSQTATLDVKLASSVLLPPSADPPHSLLPVNPTSPGLLFSLPLKLSDVAFHHSQLTLQTTITLSREQNDSTQEEWTLFHNIPHCQTVHHINTPKFLSIESSFSVEVDTPTSVQTDATIALSVLTKPILSISTSTSANHLAPVKESATSLDSDSELEIIEQGSRDDVQTVGALSSLFARDRRRHPNIIQIGNSVFADDSSLG
ncbi:hypothetical protein BLNAU_6493 [Blattamonas nauphoetae]|uniref:Pre-rRNA-processing protein RIX1 n=1 Tax=Blattamonas nauphoetae TaxID=2049346 RepID=A0ABQ9Y422_9EUKA|nr:hypothetical protein BLNAU_6493 [Blattamonas nauphoetae]